MPMSFAVAMVSSARAMHRNCSLQARFSQPARLTHPVSRCVTSVVRCKPSSKDDVEKDELVKEAVKQLRKADVDQASAREMMKLWKENGVTEDPEELRKLYKDRGNTAIARFTVQLALDALACFAAYQAAVSIDANADFFGKPVLVFLFSAVAFNYVLAFLSNLLSLGISVNSMMRFGTNAAAYLEAVKEIAGPTSLDSVTKVQSAIDSYKIARSLEKMDTYLKERAVEVGGKMATMESLAVYFILNEARDKLGFAPEEYGLSDDDAVTIARMFAKYDANGDGRIDSSELRSLCTDAGKTLTEEETEAALQAIDDNNNGVIEFNEFVGFWVNPSKYVTELKTISEAKKKDEAEGEKAGQDEKQPVASVSNK